MTVSSAPSPEIARDHLVRTLATLLEGETETVVLEGVDGIGKTTLLKQFAGAHHDRTLPLRITGSSRHGYDPFHLAFEFASQMCELLRGRELTAEEATDMKVHGQLIAELGRKGRRDGKPYFVMMDGLEEIPRDGDAVTTQLLELLPFGLEGIRFLLTGDLTHLPLNEGARRKAKSWAIPFFTREESDRYLQGLALSPEQLEEVYKTTQGVPGHLASIRRRLSGSDDVAGVVRDISSAGRDSLEREWGSVADLTEPARICLGLLAFEKDPQSVDDLAGLVGAPSDIIERDLRRLHFLRHEGAMVGYVSDAFRRFATEKLADLRVRVNEAIVDSLLKEPDSEKALAQLSTAYSRAERFQDVLDYLSPERFARLYQRTPSLKVVKQKADEGIAAARLLQREGELVRFTLQKSTLEELASSDVGVAEVRAMSALGDFEGAIGLAIAVTRQELQLRLLAAIARVRRDQDLPEDPDLNARIRAVYVLVDPETLGDALPATASDLFAVAPELATELISRMTGRGGENAIDWALASLTIQAHAVAADPHAREHAREISARIQHPGARKLSLEAGVILGGLSARDVISESERLEATGDKLFVLRRWMASNRQRDDAEEVLACGIRLALQATGYSANADAFRELALCLPYMSNVQAVTHYTGILDAQRAELERIGPPDGFIRLQLIMARAEWRHDRIAARARFIEAFNSASRVKDLVIRVGCVARLVSALARTDPDKELDVGDELHALAVTELEDGMRLVLGIAAEHHEASRAVVQALAVGRPDAALGVVRQLNTEYRRDLAYAEFVEAAVAVPAKEIQPGELLEAINSIVDPSIRDGGIVDIAQALQRRRLAASEIARVLPLVRLVEGIYAAPLRSLTANQLLAAVMRSQEAGPEERLALHDAAEALRLCGQNTWRAIEADCDKVELGYDIVVALASVAPQLAKEYAEDVNALRRRLTVGESEALIAATLGLRLANRALAPLLGKGLVDRSELVCLLASIARVGSSGAQAELLGDLALRLTLAKRPDEGKEVVRDHLIPLIYSINDLDVGHRDAIIVATSPALAVGVEATARRLIMSLPEPLRSEALDRVALFLLRKTSPWDPYESRPGMGFEIDFEDANKVLQAVAEMDADWQVYYFLRLIVESVSEARLNGRIKGAQRAEIVRQLDSMSKEKFPNARFIKHDGYRIAAQAVINKLREPSEVIPVETLAMEARQIPNVSDRAFVLAILASTAKQARTRHGLLTEATTITDSIPMLADRLDLYHNMSSLLTDVDEAKGKELLKRAVELSFAGEGESIAERRRSLVELACRVYPDIAGSLASMTDNDPAKQRIESHLRLHAMKNALATRRPATDSPSPADVLEWSQACWMKLGSLIAGRSAPGNPAKAMGVLEYAAKQPLSRSYPIVAWYIENEVRARKGTGMAATHVLPLYHACLVGSELALLASARANAVGRPREIVLTDAREETLVGDGQREVGLQFIRKWLIESSPRQLWIVEPYFRPDAIELLALIADACEECSVYVLCGRKESLGASKEAPEEVFRKAWRRIRSDEPPHTTIMFVQKRQSGSGPFHDRWWLAANTGLGCGTSYDGIGSKLSEIRVLDAQQVAARHGEIRPYLDMTKREFEGERLDYSVCTL